MLGIRAPFFHLAESLDGRELTCIDREHGSPYSHSHPTKMPANSCFTRMFTSTSGARRGEEKPYLDVNISCHKLNLNANSTSERCTLQECYHQGVFPTAVSGFRLFFLLALSLGTRESGVILKNMKRAGASLEKYEIGGGNATCSDAVCIREKIFRHL